MEKQTKAPTLGFFAALSTVIGTVIGSGIFFKATATASATGTVTLSLFVWLLGGLITICAGLTTAELAAAFPQTGGLTIYIQKSYGHFWGFLAGWAQALIYFPAQVAAAAIAFATQVLVLFNLGAHWLVPIALLTTLTVLSLNLVSAAVGGWVSTVTMVVKLLPIVVLVVLGFFHQRTGDFTFLPVTTSGHPLATSLGAGLLATMFAYDGWIHVGNLAGEMKNPRVDLPRAITLGLGLVTLIYLLVNAVFLYVAPLPQVAHHLNIANQVAHLLFGPLGGKIITVGIMISVYGALNGFLMTGMRVPLVMGRLGYFPWAHAFAALNRGGVPWVGGLIQFAIAALMMLSGTFDTITNMLVVVIWCFYCLAFGAVFILRRRQPDLVRPYRVPGYPLIPVVALIGGLFIVITTLITQPLVTGTGVLATALGIPVYYYQRHHGRLPD